MPSGTLSIIDKQQPTNFVFKIGQNSMVEDGVGGLLFVFLLQNSLDPLAMRKTLGYPVNKAAEHT